MLPEIQFSARAKNSDSTTYLPLEQHNLLATTKCLNGDGSHNNPYNVTISISNQGTQIWEGVLHTELCSPKSNPRFFLPGFMYGRNRGESPQNTPVEFPRLREQDAHRPSSTFFMVRGDRLACPIALVYDAGAIWGFHAAPYLTKGNAFLQYTGYSCNISKPLHNQEYCSVGYTLGYENAPWLFIESHDVVERAPLTGESCIALLPGEAMDMQLAVYSYQADKPTDIHAAIKAAYQIYHEAPRKVNTLEGNDYVKNAVKDIATPIYEDAWLPEEKSYSGFVFQNEDGSFRYNKIGSLSWTNGLSVIVPMLMSSLCLQNDAMREQTLTAIDYILANCMNPASGLPYDAVSEGKWSTHGWWFDGMHTPGHSAYIAGQAMYYICKAYHYEKLRKNIVHDDWLAFVRPVLARMEREKNTEHEYPFVFSEKNGTGLEYDSFSGAWCLAAIAYYSWLTNDTTYLEGMKQSEQHYYDAYVAQVECYGGPMDTSKAVDSEGILAYIRAVRYLHAITQDDTYLSHMGDALDYEYTYKFCYNSPVKVPPLSTIGWSSCGGSITSTCNPHIHPMSSTIVDEILYYYEQTKDSYTKERLMDVILWGCQTYNTYEGEYGYGKKGWMSERFCYSEGLVKERFPDGTLASTWFALMPWAGASILEGLAGDLQEKINK